MAAPALRTLAILPLLFAVLSAGLVPHLHAHADTLDPTSAPRLERPSDDAPPATRALEAGGCLACRSGHSQRLAAIATSPTPHGAAPLEPGRMLSNDPRGVAASLLRATTAPRAPPA
jgi:hypothetical protein